jgi:phosphatidylinositol alpha-mannosyltransferase
MEAVARSVAERTFAAGALVSVLTSALPRRAPAPGGDAVPVTRCAAFEAAHTPVVPGLLARLLRLPGDAVVHLHVAQPLVPETVYLASRLRSLPFLAHVHLDVGPSGPLGFLLPAYKRRFLGPVLRAATAVVVYTEDYVPLVCRAYGVPAGRVHVIPGGIDPPPPQDGDGARREDTVLFVGRLSPQKNLFLLLDALRLLRERGRPASLRIVGEGEEEGRIREGVRARGFDGCVVLLGRLEGENLAREFRSAALLALPSERESFGLVLVEAMGHGTPVVATDIPGVRNVVEPGRTGLLAAADPESFAAALEALLADGELRRRLSENGLREAVRYDWREIVPRYMDLYERIRREASP